MQNLGMDRRGAAICVVLVLCACTSKNPGPPPWVNHVLVPDAVGLSGPMVHEQFDGVSLTVRFTRTYSARSAGTVLSQSPPARTEVEKGSVVVLSVARPYPRLPDLTDSGVVRAVDWLRRSKFRVGWRHLRFSNERKGTVIAQYPASTDHLKPGRVVNLLVSKGPRTPPPPKSPCSPYYYGCLPIVADLDCLGGEGNGPYVAGPVYLKGSYDPYGLDGYDNDGIGCE
jgi:hypothetical protein